VRREPGSGLWTPQDAAVLLREERVQLHQCTQHHEARTNQPHHPAETTVEVVEAFVNLLETLLHELTLRLELLFHPNDAFAQL